MSKTVAITCLLLLPAMLIAQERYATRTGHISFFSATPMENIEGNNHKVTCVIDATTGAIEFAALMKAFEFQKALMQEHFNENYVESQKFPKATFKGKLIGLPDGALQKPGIYDVHAEGDLTIHGVTRNVTEKAQVSVNPTGAVKAISTFHVKPEDHGIKIPGTVRANIAETMEVKVDIELQKM